ncbi:MAG: TonB-dependent receptor [Ignavibacteriaceae bacterium]
MEIKKILFLYFFVFIINLFPQNGSATLNGFVYDKSNGEALIGANVYLKEIGQGASSNTSGYFVVAAVPAGEFQLAVSFIGYRQFNQKIIFNNGEDKRLDIYLEPQAVQSDEVVVTADSVRTIDRLFNKGVSKIELSPMQLSKVPQVIEADLLRTLQTLPGIVPLSDFSSSIYVRGGTPDQNLFLVDGTDVYNPEHAFGLFSTFNTDAIKKVEIYKGGFSAEYGGRLSSVLNVTNNDGNRNKFEGKASLSLLSLGTTLQTPLGSIGSLSGSIRRTYIDQTLAKVIDDVPDYYFIDGNLKAFFDIDEKNKLSVSFYGGQDDLNFVVDKDRPDSFGFDYIWGNQTASINWRTILSPRLFANFWITGSRFFSDFDFEDVGFTEENRIRDVTFKGALEYFLSDHWDFKFGFEHKNLSGSLKEDFEDGRADVSKSRKHYSAYVTSNWRPSPLWDIETGLRFDYFDSDVNYNNLDPRLTVKYRLDETSNLKFSTGLFHQYLNRIPRLFFISIWTTADEYTKGSSATHFILGYQKAIARNLELEIEGYYKDYNNIYSYNENYLVDLTPEEYDSENKPIYKNTNGFFNEGKGRSIGAEILLRKDVGAITGWVAYSYANTQYTIKNINQGKEFPPRHDRTSVVNVVANFDLDNVFRELRGEKFISPDKKWSLGLNFTYFSGQPITLPGSVYLAFQMPDWQANPNSIAIYPSGINEYRLPAYIRLDLSLTYEIQYNGWSLAPYLQVFNALNRKNVWFIEYENEIKDNTIKQKVETVNMFPILPSIGVNIRF